MLIEFLHLGDHPGLYIIATKNRPFALLGTKAVSAGKIGNLGFRVATTHVFSVVETLPKLVEISKLAKKNTLLFCVFLEPRKSVPKQSGKQLRFQPANFRGMG